MTKAKEKSILLTFDVEEFNLPHEYNHHIPIEWEYSISHKGLLVLLNILKREKVKATFFVTTNFAKRYPVLIRHMGKKHEIASHGYSHSDDYRKMKKDVLCQRLGKGKRIVEKIIGKRINGFRAPRFHLKRLKWIEGIFKYDSSLHPTYIPGRYNNFFTERRIHMHGSLLEIPVSVTPVIRLPLFWFVFRNIGVGYARFCTNFCFFDSDYMMLLFHPWEFEDISNIRVPKFIKRDTGKILEQKLTQYIQWAKKKGFKFKTVHEFLHEQGYLEKSCR